jgi:hypothetical protein
LHTRARCEISLHFDGKRPARHRTPHAIDANVLALDRKRATLGENTRSLAEISVGIGRNTSGGDEIYVAHAREQLAHAWKPPAKLLGSSAEDQERPANTVDRAEEIKWIQLGRLKKAAKANQLQSLAHGRTH